MSTELQKPPGDYIWIADSNLFRSAFSRRYILGLSAWSGCPIGLTPSLIIPQEVPAQIARGLLGKRHDEDIELTTKLMRSVRGWLDDNIRTDRPMVLLNNADQTDATKDRLAENPNIFSRDPISLQLGNDLNIVSEALAAGCTFVATMNIRSINHSELNDWVRSNLGYNEAFIGPPDELSQRLLAGVNDEALVVAAMSVSDQRRELTADLESWEFFRIGLAVTFSAAALHAKDSLLGHEITQEELIRQGRAIAQTPRFKLARRLETELQSLCWETLAGGSNKGFAN